MIFNFFKKKAEKISQRPEQHAVVVNIRGPDLDLDEVYKIEDTLTEIVNESDVGEVDGHDCAIDGSDANFYLYGPSADELFSVIETTLRRSKFSGRILCKLRYGDVKNPKVKISEISI